MGIVDVILIGIGLSMDAFAVSICKGLGMKRVNKKQMVIIALFFGGFQGLMPLIGYALSASFQKYIEPVDHWIAFGLLAIIGGKMIVEAIRSDDDETVAEEDPKLDYKELFMLAIATSIDALATGIAFAAVEVNIIPAVILIGITTFIFSIAGVLIGNKFGSRYEKPSSIIGGIVLICIGLKVLFEHLGIITF